MKEEKIMVCSNMIEKNNKEFDKLPKDEKERIIKTKKND